MTHHSHAEKGMTLVETLIAVTILSVAIVAPMTLTMQSLSSAYYARDQVIAFNLAQEAIESVRAKRDGNILTLALNSSATCPDDGLPMHLLCGIPIGADFMIDTRDNAITSCNADGDASCDPLQTDEDETLYGYENDPDWSDTQFTRTVHAEFVDVVEDEIRITVTIVRETGQRAFPAVTISENLYKWVEAGSGT